MSSHHEDHENRIRERAHALREKDGRPEGTPRNIGTAAGS
jgi:Protein of unknown function (DUF2934)